MLEKPLLSESLLCSQVRLLYALDVNLVSFLPLGYDRNTAVYRVETTDQGVYFLKLRKGDFQPVTVALPEFLNRQGIRSIIAPLETVDHQLFGSLEQYATILYPFIPGKDGYEQQPTSQQWIELGRTLRQVHESHLPEDLVAQIPREAFDPQWRQSVCQFLQQAGQVAYNDPVARDLSSFIQAKRAVISDMVQRANDLADTLRIQPLEFVLCHNDAHPGNYHLTEAGELYLVDWDNPIFAPRERDLMCFGGGMSGDQPGGREERWFYQGYGPISVNQQALAYYRYERVIQDISEFCKQIFLSTAGGSDRAQSLHYLISSFQPGSVVEAAYQTDPITRSTV